MTGYLSHWPSATATGSAPLLLCLPPAGTGAGMFRPLAAALPDAEVVAVQLPGRERRFLDPPPRDLAEVVDAIVSELVPRRAGRPLVVLGDSLGGLIGFEVALRCAPDAFVALACRAPRWWTGTEAGITDEDVSALLAGAADEADLDPDSRALAAAVLVADAALTDGYALDPTATLSCPVHAWGGSADRTVTGPQLDGWADVTTGPFERRTFAADHHRLTRCPAEVVQALATVVAAATRLQEVSR